MKNKGSLTRAETGLLVLTGVFLCLMVCIVHHSQTGTISGDYTIITQQAPPEPVTPVVEPRGPVDINTASAEALQQLRGVGPAIAERIVAYRTEHGPFTSVEELLEVRGIGEATLAEIREEITLGDAGGLEEDSENMENIH